MGCRSYVPQYCLEWEYRKNTVAKEIGELYLSDIICLQECEDDDYKDIYLPLLESKGMIGTFRKRPGLKHDGSAILFNKNKFRLVGEHGICFDSLDDVPLLKAFKRGDYFTTANIAHIVMLEHLLPSGGTHRYQKTHQHSFYADG
jgi:mRNA deadenylase 3'-5' endonuclease subunit Ccr4